MMTTGTRTSPLRRLLPRCALAGALILAWPVPGQAQADRYGVVNDNIVTSQASVQLMRDAGFGWIRYNLNWNLVNPAPGVYDWSNPDREIGFAKAAGLKIYLTVTTPPTWTTGASYPNDQAILYCFHNPAHPDCQRGPNAKIPTKAVFETFATALVGRYANDVDVWGFGSEVHDTAFWTGTPEQFVERILVPGYTIVKQIAGTPVAGPDEDTTDSLDYLLQLEATYGTFCDVIAFHVLRQSTPDLPLRLGELKAVVDLRGQGREVWVTELGMPALETDCLLEGIQADWLRVAIQEIDARPWITRVFVYRIENGRATSDLEFGLLNTVGTSRTAWHVVRNLITGEQPTAYLAEGAAGSFFDLDIAIANSTCATATAKVTFLRESGAPLEQAISLPPRTRSTIRADDVVNPGGVGTVAASTVVQTTNGVPLVIERTMFWDAGYYAGHTGSAVTKPATTWYFGEGSQGFFDTYVLLANSSASTAHVTVRFLREAGGPVLKNFDVGPNSRVTVFAGSYPSELAGTSFSIVVASDVPIIAERAMYFGSTPFWSAGHESAGVPAPATTWYHAEGATGDFFDTFILVGNPNDQVATVTFTYLLESGQVITKTEHVQPQSRLTVHVDHHQNDPALSNVAVSTTVSSDVPIVSERAMYWAGPFTSWYEAHNSFGVTETGLRWVLAEGRVGGTVGFETYILVANPGQTPASVRVTFLRGAGQSVACTFTVPATSRFNVHANGLNTSCAASAGPRLLSDESFGALIESVNGVPIFAERAMYWNAGGLVWAGGTNATATLMP